MDCAATSAACPHSEPLEPWRSPVGSSDIGNGFGWEKPAVLNVGEFRDRLFLLHVAVLGRAIEGQMTLLLEYLVGFVCFLIGAVFCVDAINSQDAWSLGIALTLFTAAFLLVRRKRHQYVPPGFNEYGP